MKQIYRPWTEEDNKRLIDLIDAGISPQRAVTILKRTMSGVRSQARRLGKRFPTMLERRNALKEAEPAVSLSVPMKKTHKQRLAAERLSNVPVQRLHE